MGKEDTNTTTITITRKLLEVIFIYFQFEQMLPFSVNLELYPAFLLAVCKVTWKKHTKDIHTKTLVKRNQVLIHCTTWMNLGNIMLRENKATHKRSYAV